MNTEYNAGIDMPDPGPEARLLTEATHWRSQLQAAPHDPALGARLDTWLAQSTAHRLAYAEVADLDYLLRLLPMPAPARALVPVRRGARHAFWHTARALVALVVVAWGWLNLPGLLQDWRADHYTGVGQISRFSLADGSILALDSDSAVRLNMDESRRELELWRGTAYVEVVADPARAFVVRTATLSATALGTAYSVEFESSRVAVTEGRVQVASELGSVELGAGQSALPSTTGWQVVQADAAHTPDWTRGHRAFAQRPLREVLQTIDRYLPGRMWLRETAVLAAPVTAVFDLTDPELALTQLCTAYGLRARFWPGLIVIEAQ